MASRAYTVTRRFRLAYAFITQAKIGLIQYELYCRNEYLTIKLDTNIGRIIGN